MTISIWNGGFSIRKEEETQSLENSTVSTTKTAKPIKKHNIFE